MTNPANKMKTREIKFRAWDNEGGRWIEPEYVRIEGTGDIRCALTSVNERELIIVQYTGLKDKNGKEIYEGDLFGKMGGDVERPSEYEIHARVYFDMDLGAFCIDDNRGGWEYLADYLLVSRNERDVIGNIFENPELLEEIK